MATTYGLTAEGFVLKTQQQIISEIQAAIQQVFGNNVNFAANSNFSQLTGIFAEREALLWELGQAVYASQYPAGAEGTSVDNILALNNLRRLKASPTVTNPTPVTGSTGITLYGLVLFGTPGTIVESGSLIQTNASPPVQFSLDSAVTILPLSNAVQNLFFSNTPTSGAFTLSIQDVSGKTLTTSSIPYDSAPNTTLLSFASVPTVGSFALSLTAAGVTLTTGSIAHTATAAVVQGAINALSGYAGATVSGSFSSGFVISWGSVANPVVTLSSNTLGVTATVVNSIQSSINSLYDSSISLYPFTDVTVAVGSAGYAITFGGGTASSGQPVSSAQAQNLITVASNTLESGTSVTNIQIVNQTQGAPAQGIGTATCISNGPNYVAAGSLNTIGSPISGWSGVINQLDCITGSNVESDTAALARRQTDLQSQANGPLQAIEEKVRAVANVTTAIGFENLNDAALQVISFAVTPTSGSYQLSVNGFLAASLAYNASASAIQEAIQALSGYSSVLVTGSLASGFTVDFNGSYGGQAQPLIQVVSNTTGSTLSVSFGRPGHSIEIVALGGSDTAIANAILNSKPAGIQSYGSTTVTVFDSLGTARTISFSRPTEVPIYCSITLLTDTYNTPGDSSSGLNPNAQFNAASIATIQQDIVVIGNAVSIGGLIIGFGTNGLIGAFNAVPGIISYSFFFGTTENPTTNTNIQMLSEQTPVFESFNIAVAYT